MNFAQSILQKYGWSEGQGLGKTNSGISKPVKATFKFDNAGLGHDSAADFNNHWWERVYNDATSNIRVSGEDCTQIETKCDSDDAVDISTATINYRKLKKKKDSGNNALKFGSFVKTATLTNVGKEDMVENRVNLEEFRHDPVQGLTDEQLFKACGGRTAHKGARHGLNLTGKLARLAQQDALLLEKMGVVSDTTASSSNRVSEEEDELSDILYKAEYTKRLSKKKKKLKRHLEVELSNSLDSFSLQSPTREEEDEKYHRLSDKSGSVDKKKKHKSKKNKIKKHLIEMVSLVKDVRHKKGSVSEDDIPNKVPKKKSSEKKSKSDDEVTVVKKKKKSSKSEKKENSKESRKRSRMEIESYREQRSDSDTETTELDDSFVGLDEDDQLPKRIRTCEVPMQPMSSKSKRRSHKRHVSIISKSFSANVQLEEGMQDSGNED